MSKVLDFLEIFTLTPRSATFLYFGQRRQTLHALDHRKREKQKAVFQSSSV
jgi:hypothetical protein